MAAWIYPAGILALLIRFVSAQVLVNGQVFTNGLAIYDAPAPYSVMHAGSPFDLAVDVSGNGKLSQSNYSSYGLDSLNIFLVSSQTAVNLTVVTSPGYLQQEPDSTVKHFNSPIPTCLPSGEYNITLYELSHLANNEYFSITSIPITIENDTPAGPCSNMNALQPQPQPSSPFGLSPFLDGSPTQPIVFPQVAPSSSGPVPPLTLLGASGSIGRSSVEPISTSGAPPDILTYTLGPSSIQWPLTITPPGMTVPIVVEPSGYTIPDTITVNASVVETETDMITQTISESSVGSGTVVVVLTPTFSPTPVTVVFVTVDTVTTTSTGSGMTSIYTMVETSYTTTTGVMGSPTDAANSNYAGFLPINAVSAGTSLLVPLFWTIFPPLASIIIY